MSTEQRNDPAYPVPEAAGHDEHFGLTKRELFAAMAMQGSLSNAFLSEVFYNKAVDVDFAAERIAQASLRAADALLAALEKTP